MRRKVAFLIAFAALGAFASAQTRIRLEFDDAAPREVWVSGSPSPEKSVKVAKKSEEITAGSTARGQQVWVLDLSTGNLASIPVEKATGTVRLTNADFTRVGRVIVRLDHAGRPVAAAQVALKDKRREQSQLLDPSSNGELSFYALEPGEVTLTVRYRSGGRDATPIRQIFNLPLNRVNKPVPEIKVSIPDEVATVGEPSAAASPDAAGASTAASPAASPAPKFEQPSFLGRILSILVGLAIVGGLIYLVLRFAKQKPDLVQDKLQQLGVDIPKPVDSDPIPASIAPIKPEPVKPILLDDADPTPLTAAPVAAAPLTGIWRLSLPGGDAFELPEGETVIGRELGLGLSLPSETTVSRRHAAVTRAGTTVTVQDLGSSNGTYVNGARLSATATLRPGDTLQLGQWKCRVEA